MDLENELYKVRRELAATKTELRETKKKLTAVSTLCTELRTQLSKISLKAHEALHLLLPEGTKLVPEDAIVRTNWDNYEEPGW